MATENFEMALVAASVTHRSSMVETTGSYQEPMSFGLVGHESQVTTAWTGTVYFVNIRCPQLAFERITLAFVASPPCSAKRKPPL